MEMKMRIPVPLVLIALCVSPTIGAQHRSSAQAVVNENPLTLLAAEFTSTGRSSCDAGGRRGAVGGPAAQWAAAFSRLPGTVNAATTSRSLPTVTQGVDGTTDQTLNMTLPDGVFLSGPVNNLPPGASASISARASNGTVYTGSVDSALNTYSITVADADTYSLQVCISMVNPPSGSTVLSYADPTPVPVSGDTAYTEVLPSATTHGVSGHLLNPDPQFQIKTITLGAQDGTAAGSASVGFDNSWQTNVPDGTYVVILSESTFFPSVTTTSLVLGTVMVSGADVIDDVTAPATLTITGTVSMADGSAPGNGFITFADVNAPPPGNGCVAAGVNSALASLDSGGNYQFSVATGVTYSPQTIVSTGSTSSSGFLIARFAPVTPDPSSTVVNVSEPALPGTHMFSGQVADAGGAAVLNASIGAITQQITGVGVNAVFSVGATSDSSGNFSLPVLDGSNYTISAVPPAATGQATARPRNTRNAPN
jgi:hypothetical protein